MNATSAEAAVLGPLLIYFFAVIGLVVAMILLSHFLGPRRHDCATDEPFESGIVSVGSARFHVFIPFYLVAILFVIFDLEAVFLFAYAVSFRETGWLGYTEMVIFVCILAAALFYLWRIGALEWGTPRQKLHAKPTSRELQS